MSSVASIALLVLAVELIVLVFAAFVGLVVASVGVVESTALVRRALRRGARGAKEVERKVDRLAKTRVLEPLVKVERATVWARTFLRELRSRH